MTCDQFLRGYSELRDGWLEPAERREFEDHLQQCAACRRYDRVLRRGVQILRSLPEPHSSPDFLPRLKHRIYHVEDGAPIGSRAGGSAALMAVASVGILALAWLPFVLRAPVELELPAVTVSTAPPAGEVAPAGDPPPSLFRSGPFVTPVLDERGSHDGSDGRWRSLSHGSWGADGAGWRWLAVPDAHASPVLRADRRRGSPVPSLR